MTHAQLGDSRVFSYGRNGFVGYLSLGFTVLGMGIMMMGASKGCAENKPPETLAPAPQSISVYALSRGKGVPDQAMAVLTEARDLLKAAQDRGEIVRMKENRIGIEGETKLCAEFSDEKSAQPMIDQIRQLGKGVDLVQIKAEPCPS